MIENLESKIIEKELILKITKKKSPRQKRKENAEKVYIYTQMVHCSSGTTFQRLRR
jgi:hypothetical protein